MLRLLVLFTLLAACGPGLPDMRRLDDLVMTAETKCLSAPDEPKAAKLSVCKRALACIEPAKQAQHKIQAMLITMSRMEDSADDRLAASAANAAALAACGIAGVQVVKAKPVPQPATATTSTP